MRQVLERWLHGAHTRLRRLPPPPPSTGHSARRDRAFPRSAPEAAAGAESRARWRARYDEVRRRHLAGETLLGIGRATGLAPGTVRKYARAEGFPAQMAHGPGAEHLRSPPPLPRATPRRGLRERTRPVARAARARLSRQHPAVHRWLAERRTEPARTGPRARCSRGAGGAECRVPARDGSAPLPPVPRLAWLLVQPAAALDAADAAVVAQVKLDAQAAGVAAPARRFTALVRACGAGRRRATTRDPTVELDEWLAGARTCGASAIATFAAGLEADGPAVRAALTQPRSSGQAEGQITKLKLLKRQSFGRAGLDLLRRRVLPAA